jgi:ABC-type Zn2+ transport system substrate-binding protein/surface adhesin
MSCVLCLSFAAMVGVPAAAMVGVSTNHHPSQLIVKKVVGGDTDHGLVTPTTASYHRPQLLDRLRY